jgi:hypothetical protein
VSQRVSGSASQRVGVVSPVPEGKGPGAPIGTQHVGELAELAVGLDLCYPTLAARTKARQGWGTRHVSELAVDLGSWYPRSPKARDRGHPFSVVNEGPEKQPQVLRLPASAAADSGRSG